MSDMTSAEDRHNQATDSEKIDGIVDQMKGDMSQGHVGDISDVLRQRLADAGLTVSDEEFDALIERLR